MNPLSLLNWMLLSTALLGAWWACYRLALRPERSFGYNRAFLVLGPLLAAGLPLLPLAWPAGWWGAGPAGLSGVVRVLLPAAEVTALSGAADGAALDWKVWLLVVYMAGAGLLLARLLLALARLWRNSRRLPRTRYPGYTLAKTCGQLPTSSFGRLIFWDETLPLSPAEARQVLAHELAHVRQGHTHDRLLLELLRAVLWFNPFVHYCGRALALTHEFLADEAALQADSWPVFAPSYTQLLARQVAGRLGFPVPLAHSFSHSQTLNRIAMIQKTTPVRRWKQWLAAPLLGVLFLAVACDKAAPQTEPALASASQNAKSLPAPAPASVVYQVVDQMPELPGAGGGAAIVTAIQQRIVYPEVAAADRKSGRAFVSFVVDATGKTQPANIIKSLGPEYDAAVVTAIRQLPRFVPGRKDGQAVAVSYTVPVTFK